MVYGWIVTNHLISVVFGSIIQIDRAEAIWKQQMKKIEEPPGAKDVLKDCIVAYKLIHHKEYADFLEQQRREVLDSAKHGLIQDTRALGEWRKLATIPVTLFNIIKSMMTEEQWLWFNSEEGKLWLVTTYKEFLAREKI